MDAGITEQLVDQVEQRELDLAERFRCVPLLCSLSRASCASRSRSARKLSDLRAGQAHLLSHACATCEVGRAHARGEVATHWPTGAPLEIAPALGTVPPPAPLVPRSIGTSIPVAGQHATTAARKPRPRLPGIPKVATSTEVADAGDLRREVGTMPQPERMITHKGRTMSVSDWADEIGISKAAFASRVKTRGEAEAIAMGKNPPRGGAAIKAREETPRAVKAAKPSKKPPPPASSPGPAAEAVRAQLTAFDPIELLRSLGYAVDAIGITPSGDRLFRLLAPATDR